MSHCSSFLIDLNYLFILNEPPLIDSLSALLLVRLLIAMGWIPKNGQLGRVAVDDVEVGAKWQELLPWNILLQLQESIVI